MILGGILRVLIRKGFVGQELVICYMYLHKLGWLLSSQKTSRPKEPPFNSLQPPQAPPPHLKFSFYQHVKFFSPLDSSSIH